jgi:hypothetical protein
VFSGKRFLITIIVLVLLAVAAYLLLQNNHTTSLPTPVPTPTLSQVTSSPSATLSPTITEQSFSFPKGGEKLIKGQTYTLKWSGGHDTTTLFLIDKSLESQGVSVSITDHVYNLKNTGSFDYTVPATIQDGTYKFQLDKLTSNYFTIASK